MIAAHTLSTRFMGSTDNYDKADIVMVGVPMDFTCSFRPGTRFGPQKIREVSVGIEEYSVYMNKDLTDKNYYDAGDLDLPYGNVNRSLEMIGTACKQIITDNKFPVFIGGEHLISLPIIKEIYKKYGDELVILHFDAHADLRQDYLGEHYSHASVMRRVCEFVKTKNIFQFGIRSGTKAEFEYGKANTNMYLFEVLEPLREVVKNLGERPVYVTLDIDVVDPAFANGTGTPEPGGCTSSEMIRAIYEISKLHLVGFDLVEVSPGFDPSDRTALLAAKLIRDVILSV